MPLTALLRCARARLATVQISAVRAQVDKEGSAVCLKGAGVETPALSSAWLLDHANESRHEATRQRQRLISELRDGVCLRSGEVRSGVVSLRWSSRPSNGDATKAGLAAPDPPAYTTTHTLEHVRRACAADAWLYHSEHEAPRSWGRGLFDAAKAPVAHAEDLRTREGLLASMRLLWEYGVLRVRDTPRDKAGMRALVERIGPPRRTYYGEMWSTRAATGQTAGVQDTAYLDVGIKPHTDGTYFRDPPGLQVLACVSQANDGGHSLLVDGQRVLEVLRAVAPDTLRFFATTPLPWFSYDEGVRLSQLETVLRLDAVGNLEALRFNEYDRGDLPAGTWYDDCFLPHWRVLVACVNRPEHVERVLLQPGEGLIVNNHRVLHGRTAFAGGSREMIGCYVGRDEFESRLRDLGLMNMYG